MNTHLSNCIKSSLKGAVDNYEIVESKLQSDSKNTTIFNRRIRYSGFYPKEFHLKYKEIKGDAIISEKVTKKGSTPAGQHIPIMMGQCMDQLNDAINSSCKPLICVDCTLGYGGHSKEILRRLYSANGGFLYGMDQDSNEILKTTFRLQSFLDSIPHNSSSVKFAAANVNFRRIREFLNQNSVMGKVDYLLADLGLSSMQIDNSTRGFSHKRDGPLDMRMNLSSPLTAESYLSSVRNVSELAAVLAANSDEPLAIPLAHALLGLNFRSTFSTPRSTKKTVKSNNQISSTIDVPKSTAEFRKRVEAVCQYMGQVTGRSDVVTADFISSTAARAMQAIRIEVNEEFKALDSLLAEIPAVLAPGGRAVFLTFHSGEDRRVKQAFKKGLLSGLYSDCSRDVVRATDEERRLNPRSKSAKMRQVVVPFKSPS